MPKNGAGSSPLQNQDQLSNQTIHFLVGRARFGWIAATNISFTREHGDRYLMNSYFATVTVSASMGMSRLKVCLNARPIMSPELLGKLKTNQSYASTAKNSARSWTAWIVRFVVALAISTAPTCGELIRGGPRGGKNDRSRSRNQWSATSMESDRFLRRHKSFARTPLFYFRHAMVYWNNDYSC